MSQEDRNVELDAAGVRRELSEQRVQESESHAEKGGGEKGAFLGMEEEG